jgi:hypothetical protein
MAMTSLRSARGKPSNTVMLKRQEVDSVIIAETCHDHDEKRLKKNDGRASSKKDIECMILSPTSAAAAHSLIIQGEIYLLDIAVAQSLAEYENSNLKKFEDSKVKIEQKSNLTTQAGAAAVNMDAEIKNMDVQFLSLKRENVRENSAGKGRCMCMFVYVCWM